LLRGGDDDVADVPADVLIDFIEQEEHELDVGGIDLSGPPDAVVELLGAGASDDAIVVDAARAAEAPEEVAEISERAPLPTFEEFRRACRVDAQGYVTCSLEPWAVYPTLGRITSWPKRKPEAERSSSCHCNIHRECKVARKRSEAADDTYLRWLHAGTVPEDGGAPVDLVVLGRNHGMTWYGIV